MYPWWEAQTQTLIVPQSLLMLTDPPLLYQQVKQTDGEMKDPLSSILNLSCFFFHSIYYFTQDKYSKHTEIHVPQWMAACSLIHVDFHLLHNDIIYSNTLNRLQGSALLSKQQYCNHLYIFLHTIRPPPASHLIDLSRCSRKLTRLLWSEWPPTICRPHLALCNAASA